MNNLHPGAKWLFRSSVFYRAVFLLIVLLILFPYLLLNLISQNDTAIFDSSNVYFVNFLFLLIFFLVISFIGEIWVRMSYKRWLYEFTSHELKIERGVIFKIYKSIPYERIQNVEIHRGILARIFGFSSLGIYTAGYSFGSGSRHRGNFGAEGVIPAISSEEAEQVREFLLKKVRGNKGV